MQYRLTEKDGADGMPVAKTQPFVMDLGSTNGTFLNGDRIEPQRYAYARVRPSVCLTIRR